MSVQEMPSVSEQMFRQVAAGLTREERKDQQLLHLTANENVLSRTAQKILSSSLGARYHIGTAVDYGLQELVDKGLVFRGLPDLYRIEALTHDVFERRLGGVSTDFRPLSGLHAMMCVIASMSQPGDTVLSIDPEAGGHFATGNLVRMLGRRPLYVGFDRNTLCLDLDHLDKLKRKHRIALSFLDEATPLYPLPFRKIREVLGPETLLAYDASHTLGLICGGQFATPILDGCDVVQGNTHKTFPGPQKGIIHFANERHATGAINAIGEALVSSQHTHHSLALYFSALEMDVFGDDYAAAVISNAQVLSAALEAQGFDLLIDGTHYTQTHQLFVKTDEQMPSADACKRLLDCGICTNAKILYGSEVIRIGVQEITRRGMGNAEMNVIAGLMKRALLDKQSPDRVRSETAALRAKFNGVRYSFDEYESTDEG